MTPTEPMTLLTDYLLGFISLYLSVLLWRQGSREKQTSIKLWGATLGILAVTSFLGGAYHGFQEFLGSAAPLLWKVTLYGMGTISFLMLCTLSFSMCRGFSRKVLFMICAVKWVLFIFWVSSHDEFRFAVYDYGSAMMLLLVVYGFSFLKGRGRESGWMVSGIIVSFTAAAIQQSSLTIGANINHNDIYHIVQIVAVYLLYKGGSLLRDQRGI